MAIVDCSVRRHLRLKSLLGLMDDPYVSTADAGAVYDTPQQRDVALRAAQLSMTLLKNDGDLLPLEKSLRSIAVIGPNAARTHCLLGDYSYSVYKRVQPQNRFPDAVKIVSILEGIQGKVSSGTDVRYAQGCDVMDTSMDGFADAIAAAAAADVVVAVLGGQSALHKNGTSGENLDRAELGLPGVQQELLEALYETGKPVVLVLANGRPLAIEWAADNVPAILEAWLPGEEGGTAVADVLFGDVNPGGKLPVSMLRTAGQAPCPYNVKALSLDSGAHYVFTQKTAVYPFGHGLSYTRFVYSDLSVAPANVRDEDALRVSCVVQNSGDCAGDEVVQLYVKDPVASTTRPMKELKGFKRIALQPGEKQQLTFTVPVEMLSLYDLDMQRIVEPGEFQIMIGASSQDIRLEGRFELLEERRVAQRTRFRTQVTVAIV